MTWTEWCFYSAGIHNTKSKEWEHTRAISWMIYKANSDPKKSARTMTTWWKLPSDPGYAKKVTRPRGKRLTLAKQKDFFNSMR